ncbi:AI-2E family transporter [Spirochaetota bacterium]
MKEKNPYLAFKENRTLKILFFVIFTLIIIGLIFIFRYYLWPFLFALILYLALRPFHEKLVKLVRKRSLSSLIVIIFLFALILAPIFLLLVSLADQTFQLYTLIHKKINSGLLQDIQNTAFAKEIIDYFSINEAEIFRKVAEFSQKAALSVLTSVTSIIAFPINFLLNLFFMVLMLFFLLKDGYKIDSSFYKILPFPDDMEENIVNRLKEVIRILLAGNLLIMILQGLMLGIGFYIVGIKMPLLWGSLAAILSLIPVVGTVLIWLPAVVYLFVTNSYLSAVFILIWSPLWYLLLENLVKPKIFGKKLNFHPLVFFFLLLGSIQAFGLTGIIIGPILLTLFYSFFEVYKLLDEYDLWGLKEKEK